MTLKCNCGSSEFEPLGIQERYLNGTGNDYRVLFLVNCARCHTTIVTNRLDYALRRKLEAEKAIKLPFFTMV